MDNLRNWGPEPSAQWPKCRPTTAPSDNRGRAARSDRRPAGGSRAPCSAPAFYKGSGRLPGIRPDGCCCKLGFLFVDVIDISERLFRVSTGAPDVWQLPMLCAKASGCIVLALWRQTRVSAANWADLSTNWRGGMNH